MAARKINKSKTEEPKPERLEKLLKVRSDELAHIEDKKKRESEIGILYWEINNLPSTDNQKQLLENLAREATKNLDSKFAQTLENNGLGDLSLKLFIEDIRSIEDLAKQLHKYRRGLEQRHTCSPTRASDVLATVDKKLGQSLETLIALVSNNVEASASWVSEQVDRCPCLKSLRNLTLSQLENYIRSASSRDQAIVKSLHSTGRGTSRNKSSSEKHVITAADFCTDRPPKPSRYMSTTEDILDALRHRTEIWTKHDDMGCRRRWSNTDEETTATPERPNNSFKTLLDVLNRCSLSGKLELFRLLLDQLYTVPLIVPTDGTDKFSFHVEALRFIKIDVENQQICVLTDITLPRVAFISDKPVELTENAYLIQSVFQCTITSLECKEKCGTTVEFGLGFLKSESLSVWMIVYVRGDFKPVTHFVKEFADIIVLELDKDTDLNDSEIQYLIPEHKHILRWKNTSSMLTTIRSDIWGISGNFNTVANEIPQALLSISKDKKPSVRKSLPGISTRYMSTKLELTDMVQDIDSFISSLNFIDMRLDLQISFAKEQKLHKEKTHIRCDVEELEKTQSHIIREIKFRDLRVDRQYELPIIQQFLNILSRKDETSRAIALHQMQASLDCCYEKIKSEQLHSDKACSKKVVKKSFGLEHLWRELGLMFIVKPYKFDYFPSLAAQHLLDGFPLEIMDGDAGAVNIKWVKKVVLKLNETLTRQLQREPTIFVTSVIGAQSTGKSTLINTMFGCNLRTSVGQCTRGVFLQMIKAQDRNFDYVLVMDTEGLRSPEYYGTDDATWRDNCLATFAVLPADVCIVTTVNEDDSLIKDVLSIVMMAFSGSTIAEATSGRMRPLFLFVYSRVDTTQQARLQENREKLIRDLEFAANCAFCSDDTGTETYQKFMTQFRTSQIESDSDIKYLGYVNKGDVPRFSDGRSNNDYGDKVVRIREYIQQRLDENCDKGQTLMEWITYLELVQDCIDTTNFELNFKTVMEYRSHNDLTKEVNKARQTVAEAYSNAFDVLVSELHDAEGEPILNDCCHTIQHRVKNTISKLSTYIQQILNKRFKQFKITENKRWAIFLEDQKITWESLLRSVINRPWFLFEEEKYEKAILDKAWEMNTKCLQEQEANKLFGEMFRDQTKAAGRDYCINVAEKIQESYQNVPHARVVDTEKAYEARLGQFSCKFDLLAKTIFSKREDIQNLAIPLHDRLMSLLNGVRQYDTAIVQRAINLTESFATEKALKRETQSDLHTMTYLILRIELTKIHNQWAAENSIANRLVCSKSRLHKRFVQVCGRVMGAKTVASDLTDMLEQAVRDGFVDYIAMDVKRSIRSKSWITNPDIMQAHIDLDLISLINNKQHKKVLEAVLNTQKHYVDVRDKLISKEANIQNSWENLMKDVRSVFKQGVHIIIKDGIKGVKMFKTAFTKKFPHDIKGYLRNQIWTDVHKHSKAFARDDWEKIGLQVDRTLSAWDIQGILKTLSKRVLGERVAVLLAREGRPVVRPRCSEACPHCGMGCTKPDGHQYDLSDLERKHNCPHQPRGLKGGVWSKGSLTHPEELLAESCTDLVANDCIFYIQRKRYFYRDFCKYYPAWASPDITQKQEVKEHIFYNYQSELLQKYPKHKKCSYIPKAYDHDLGELKKKCQALADG